MNKPLIKFMTRWVVSIIGLWIASELLGSDSISYGGQFGAVVGAGLILAVVNTFIRPIVVFFTLPAVLITVGIFMVVINALMVLFAAWIYGPLEVEGFGVALITGLVIGLVQWIVTSLFETEERGN